MVWGYWFFCLAYRDQSHQPTTDADKEVYQAGLGEKEIEFDSLDLSQLEFRELLYTSFFPAEGFQLLRGLPNSRVMELFGSCSHRAC